MLASYPVAAQSGPFACRVGTRPPCIFGSMQRPAPLLPPVAAPLKALVQLAAALPLPRDRTAVLACWMVARLALPRVPRESDISDPDALSLRAEATRRWVGAQPLTMELSLAVTRACDVAAEREPALLADALDALRDAADSVLNNGARAELTTLAQLLRRSSLAAMR
jgi:hypothetical protein